MYSFTAYGYRVRSAVSLPGFTITSKTEPVDISISEESYRQPPATVGRGILLENNVHGLNIYWPGVASYTIRNGNEITITPHCSSQDYSDLAIQPLYGIAMAAILKQKGHLVLHGSSVAIHGKGVILVARKGLGKSTLTASLVAKGHQFVTDDVTALSMEGGQNAHILCGIPRLKLWPDAVQAIGLEPKNLPIISPHIPKHYLFIPSNQFAKKNIPLQTIVMLDHGDSIAIHKLKQSEKLIWLLGGQYFTKFHNALTQQEYKLLLNNCSNLAKSVNILKLTTPRDIGLLNDITEILERHSVQ